MNDYEIIFYFTICKYIIHIVKRLLYVYAMYYEN